MVKRILFLFISFILLAGYCHSVELDSIELDTDSNGSVDINRGGTNAQTASGIRSAINVEDGAEANEPLVSQEVAEAGTSEAEYSWSPLRVFQAVAAWITLNTSSWDKDSSDDLPDAPSDGTGYVRKDGDWAAESGGSGSGDVTGPDGATAGNFPLLDATGKILSDSGKKPADFLEAETDPTVDLTKLQTLVSDDFHNLGGNDLVDDADNDPTNEIQDLSWYVETADTSAWDKNASDDFDGRYSSLSDVPSAFAPVSHGNGAHSSTYITAGDVPGNETDPAFAAWLLATPPLYPGGWYDTLQGSVNISGFNNDSGFTTSDDFEGWDTNASDDFTWDYDYTDLINKPTIPSYTFGTGLSEVGGNVICTVVDTNTTYSASDFDIKDLTDSTNLRSSWSAKLDSEVDGSTTNEIQTIDTAQLSGTKLQLSLSSDGEAVKEVELSSLQDGTGTDDQTAADVSVTTTNFGGHLANDSTSDTVQECLDLLDDIVTGGLAESDIDTSSEIATIVTDETGTGVLCFATSPDITTPAITDLSTEPAGSGDITITLAQSKRGILTDKSLTGNADFVLDDEDAYLTVHIYIVDGTDTISLVPPSGECLMMDGAFLDANDEVDLSSTEGDKFVLVRRYSTAKTDYVWDIETVRGAATDGGAGD